MNFLTRFLRSVIDDALDHALKRLMRDPYTDNLFEMYPVTRKVGLVPLMETLMRASQGKPPSRPLGSYYRMSPWQHLFFNPVHLHRMPTPEDVVIDTSVVIGPRAARPLNIAIPAMIAGMSYGGALGKEAKIALAKGATMMGTATNTGEAGLLQEERDAAQLLIGQYNRGGWLNQPEKYMQLDAIEIQLGQGAQGSTPQRTPAGKIGEEYREVFGLAPGEDAVIHSRLPGVDEPEQFVHLVRKLRDETGVPVGVKIAATHHLEKELEIALQAEVDFITVDGAEGGTHAAAPTLEDDVGLPTLFAVSRAARFLERKQADGVSLIAAGGLATPGDALKAMALGADAFYLGTMAVMATAGEQALKATPFEPPIDLMIYEAPMNHRLNVEEGSASLYRYLKALVKEMELVCYTLGKTSLKEINRDDLCTMDPFLAQALEVQWGWVSPEEQYKANLVFPAPLPQTKEQGEQEDPLIQ